MKLRLLIVAVLFCLASSPALAAEGPAYGAVILLTGGAVALVALLVLVFSTLLPFVRTGWLRSVCTGIFGLIAFAILLIGFAIVFRGLLGKEGYFFLASFAVSPVLTYVMIRWVNAQVRARLEKIGAQPAAPLPPLPEHPQPRGNPAFRTIDKRIKLCISFGYCCGLIALLAAGLGVITIFDERPYAPGARESVAINAGIIAAVLATCWLVLRLKAKKLVSQAQFVLWGATTEEAKSAAETEVDGDTRDRHATERALAYARTHAADIADFERRFIAQMTQGHSVSPDAAAAMLKGSIDGNDISLAAVWHAEGITPENKADEMGYALRRILAYDARIFPAAAGYSRAARVASWSVTAVLLAAYIGRPFFANDYTASADWRAAGGWLSLAAAIPLSAWLVRLQRSGQIPSRPDGRKPSWGTGILFIGGLFFVFSIFIMPPIGAGVTVLFGEITSTGKKSWFGEMRGD